MPVNIPFFPATLGDFVSGCPMKAGLGADGAQWIIERAKDGEYRMVDRWSPESSGPDAAFRRACETFLALAGEDLVTGDVY